MSEYAGKLADPQFRTQRARRAGKASQSAAAHITRFLAKLPELTPEQIETVRRALPPVKVEAGDGPG
jgi:hypothetical protein